jgi:hypothetical protein
LLRSRRQRVTESEHSVVLFYSTSGALRAEKLAKQAGLKVKLIPVPRHLSSDCGLCLRFESSAVEDLQAILEGSSVEFEEICAL